MPRAAKQRNVCARKMENGASFYANVIYTRVPTGINSLETSFYYGKILMDLFSFILCMVSWVKMVNLHFASVFRKPT